MRTIRFRSDSRHRPPSLPCDTAAARALDDTITELESCKDSTLIIRLLRDNLTLRMSAMQHASEKAEDTPETQPVSHALHVY